MHRSLLASLVQKNATEGLMCLSVLRLTPVARAVAVGTVAHILITECSGHTAVLLHQQCRARLLTASYLCTPQGKATIDAVLSLAPNDPTVSSLGRFEP